MSVEATVKALLRRHPDYLAQLEHWEFLGACYEGGRDWFDVNLFQYWKEGETEFEARKKRAYRFNHSREVVDLVNKYLFRPPVARGKENVPQIVQQFWRRATKNDMPVDYLVRQASKIASTFGRAYVVVDTNRRDQGVLTVAEAAAKGIRAYGYVISPLDALDMSFDENGDLNWILLRETYRDDATFETAEVFVEARYRLWTKSDWRLFSLDEAKRDTPDWNNPAAVQIDTKKYLLELIDEGTHDLGVVPVRILDNVENESPYSAPALINDIAYQDRAVANYLSNLDAIIQDQTFSQLVIPAQALMPGEESSAKEQLLEMGTKRVFLYNGEASVAPQFISPDPKQAEMIITAIKQIINEIYHSVGLAGERTKQDNSMGIDNSSGVAKAFDFDRIEALLTTKAASLQRLEHELVELVMLWNDEEPADEEVRSTWVKYPESFDVRGLADEFDIATNLSLIAAPRSVRRHQMRNVVNKILPVLSEKERNEVDAELKEWPPEVVEVDPNAPPGSVTDSKKPTQGAKQPKKPGQSAT